jgi:ABC-type sugar transport system ATPase subunit
MSELLSVEEIKVRYGALTSIHGVSLSVRDGETVCLLGANGAGKSTTFRMLCGLLPPSSGTLRVAGADLRHAAAAARSRIGYMSQKFSLYRDLTVNENMTFTATAMNSTTLSTLGSLLPTDQSILSGWTFSASDFTVSSTNPAYLSFNVGAGHPADNLDVWRYDGSAWSEYSPLDLVYDGTYASFTATSLNGFAMVVPEPGTLALLAASLIGLLAYVRYKD